MTDRQIAAIQTKILEIRNYRIILDRDLAALYKVRTSALNQAVKRNRKRFPPDFAFQLTQKEFSGLMSQIVTSKGRGGVRKAPYAFTEHGALMAANVLRSRRAIEMSVFVVRAFIRMRQMLGQQADLARKLAELEKKLIGRLDVHERAIVRVIEQIMQLLNPPPVPERPRKQIGFHAKERRTRYRISGRKRFLY